MSVEDLFAWFASRYGRRFADMWAGVDPERVKAAWREELADMGPDDIARGLSACREKDWPPSAPEFRNLCRVRIDYERAYTEAAQQWYLRQSGRDAWSNPAIYWASSSIGNDVLAYPYRFMANRWREELEAAIDAVRTGRLPAVVPPARQALTASIGPCAGADQVHQILRGSA